MSDNGLPIRSFMDDPNIQWRDGKPDYSEVDQLYLEGRTKQHAPGSIEQIVSDLAKTFEMEIRHKKRLEDMHSITPDCIMTINGGRIYTAKEMMDRGTYNVVLDDSPLFDAANQTMESANQMFLDTFTEGFAWEVLEVISEPPNAVFTWRHWSKMTGPYKGNEPTGELIELFGCVLATVTDDGKLSSINFYQDANMMLAKLQGMKCPFLSKSDAK